MSIDVPSRTDARINRCSLEDLADPPILRRDTGLIPSPARQPFVVDVRVVRGKTARGARAEGNDIYAVSAPIVVEATARLFTGLPVGVHAAGAVFNALDFLRALPIVLTLSPDWTEFRRGLHTTTESP